MDGTTNNYPYELLFTYFIDLHRLYYTIADPRTLATRTRNFPYELKPHHIPIF